MLLRDHRDFCFRDYAKIFGRSGGHITSAGDGRWARPKLDGARHVAVQPDEAGADIERGALHGRAADRNRLGGVGGLLPGWKGAVRDRGHVVVLTNRKDRH